MRSKIFTILILITFLCGRDIFSQTQQGKPQYSRKTLNGFIDQYMDALIAHSPSLLPLAKNVKFTENGQQLELGDGLWNTVSAKGTYKLYVADQDSNEVAFMGTLRENDVPAIIAIRLKIDDNKISEIETFVVRSDSGARHLEKLGNPNRLFLTSIPKEDLHFRGELIDIANLYFSGLERNDGRGLYLFTKDCNRLENGYQTTNHPTLTKDSTVFDFQALNCIEQFRSGFFRFVTRIRDRRFVVVDRERGLVFSFAFFDHAGNVPFVIVNTGKKIPIGIKRPWTWEIAELFKIENGFISQIEALYQEAPYGMGSGWSDRKSAMSNQIQE